MMFSRRIDKKLAEFELVNKYVERHIPLGKQAAARIAILEDKKKLKKVLEIMRKDRA